MFTFMRQMFWSLSFSSSSAAAAAAAAVVHKGHGYY